MIISIYRPCFIQYTVITSNCLAKITYELFDETLNNDCRSFAECSPENKYF